MNVKRTILDNEYYKFNVDVRKNKVENFNYISIDKHDRENSSLTAITIFDHEDTIHIRKTIVVNAPTNLIQYEGQNMIQETRDLELKKLSSLDARVNLLKLVIKEALKTKVTDNTYVDIFYMLEELINKYAPITTKNKLCEKRK